MMEKVFVVGINFVLFFLLQLVFAFTVYGMGYATDGAARHSEWGILICFLAAHSVLNLLLLELFKSVKRDFLWISFSEICVLYGLAFWAYYRP